MQTDLIIITHLLSNDNKGLKGVSGSILLHVGGKKINVCFYTVQYPVCWIDQSALHFTPVITGHLSRPVHSGTNSASLGSILCMQQLRATTDHSHFHHGL